jgi:hypothetical protein
MLNPNFDFIRDIAPIAAIVRVPLVIEVHPSVPAKTVAEFIAYAKAQPGKINMASAGTGGQTHLAGEMFKTMAGVDLFHVPYRGAQVFPALLTGEAQNYFGPLLSSLEYVRAGNFRALAVTTEARQGQRNTIRVSRLKFGRLRCTFGRTQIRAAHAATDSPFDFRHTRKLRSAVPSCAARRRMNRVSTHRCASFNMCIRTIPA